MSEEFIKFMGEFSAKFDSLHEDVKEIKADSKTTIAFQSATEERLKNGVAKFTNHEDRILKIEERKCPKTLKSAWAVTFITLGFTVLGLLITLAIGKG